VSYMIKRIFSLAAFGRVYGTIYAVFWLRAALGSTLLLRKEQLARGKYNARHWANCGRDCTRLEHAGEHTGQVYSFLHGAASQVAPCVSGT
jgi:hypothetical protein